VHGTGSVLKSGNAARHARRRLRNTRCKNHSSSSNNSNHNKNRNASHRLQPNTNTNTSTNTNTNTNTSSPLLLQQLHLLHRNDQRQRYLSVFRNIKKRMTINTSSSINNTTTKSALHQI